MNTYNVLSIDAWRDGPGWNWNDYHRVGEIELSSLDNNRDILKAMRDGGYLSEYSKGKVEIVDDQYNLVICKRSNHQPLFAIVYGENQ